MAKFTAEQIAELIKAESIKIDREIERQKLNKALKALLKKAAKNGFHLNKVTFAHLEAETDRFNFTDYDTRI